LSGAKEHTVNCGNLRDVREAGWMKRWLSFKPDLPYGVAIAAGGILAFPGTWWMPLAS